MVDLRNGGSQLEAQEQSKGFLSNLEVWVWMIGDCDGWWYKLGEWSPKFGLYYQSGGCACDADLCINICQFRSFDLSWRRFPSEAMEEGRSSSWLFCKLNTWAALVVVGHLMTVKMKHLQMLKLSNSSWDARQLVVVHLENNDENDMGDGRVVMMISDLKMHLEDKKVRKWEESCRVKELKMVVAQVQPLQLRHLEMVEIEMVEMEMVIHHWWRWSWWIWWWWTSVQPYLIYLCLIYGTEYKILLSQRISCKLSRL